MSSVTLTQLESLVTTFESSTAPEVQQVVTDAKALLASLKAALPTIIVDIVNETLSTVPGGSFIQSLIDPAILSGATAAEGALWGLLDKKLGLAS